jgi:hypothetical protein
MLRGAPRTLRAALRAGIFTLKVFPMLPSRPVDWITVAPVVDKVRYPTRLGPVEGQVYRPSTGGPHPGLVVCLGVVPFDVDHPQVPILGRALARSGFSVLFYWSPAMRDLRLDPGDVEDIALAYDWFLQQPYVDPARSGLLGTCVGGSFALMAAAHPLVRDRVAFASGYAPYSSMWTFARDIASATRSAGAGREPWVVDQLTRKVFVHSLTAWLEPGEIEPIRQAFADGGTTLDRSTLSPDGNSVYTLLASPDASAAESLLHRLSSDMQERLTALSPMSYLKDLHAPLIVLLHDAGDTVIPVGESRQLVAALAGRPGVHYTEMHLQHMDPVKARLPVFGFLREVGKLSLAMCLVFEKALPA